MRSPATFGPAACLILARTRRSATSDGYRSCPNAVKVSRSTPCRLRSTRGVSGYDAMYLALAEATDAVLVTADRRLAAAATRSELLD